MMVSRGFVFCFESTTAKRNRKEIKKNVKKNRKLLGNHFINYPSFIYIFFVVVYTRVPVDGKNKNRFFDKNIYYLICAVIILSIQSSSLAMIINTFRHKVKRYWTCFFSVLVFSYIFILLVFFCLVVSHRVY